MPLIAKEPFNVREYAAAVPSTVTDEPVMTAPSVDVGTEPDCQSAASDQSPDRPVIQYCVVMAGAAPQ